MSMHTTGICISISTIDINSITMQVYGVTEGMDAEELRERLIETAKDLCHSKNPSIGIIPEGEHDVISLNQFIDRYKKSGLNRL